MSEEFKVCVPENCKQLHSYDCWKCDYDASKTGVFKYGTKEEKL